MVEHVMPVYFLREGIQARLCMVQDGGPNDDPGSSSHVEMYLGDDQFVGHGSGIGPRVKTASAYTHSGKLVEVRRYLQGGAPPKPPDPPPPTGVYLVRWIPGRKE